MTMASHDNLEPMWQLHRGYIKRYLVSLARDVDLAEDLLQETYMHAWRGVSKYRGGDARSWLSTIARNVFYSYMRHARVKSEIQLDSDIDLVDTGYVGSDGHVERLGFRSLLSRLPDELRTAFLLKHHMGLTYGEIGRRVDCTEATARSRVYRALSIIRSALAETWMPATPACMGMGMNRVLDYAYELLRPESMEAVENHLKKCGPCREQVEAIRVLMRAMYASAIDRRTMRLLDYDERGIPSLHAALARVVHEDDAPFDSIDFRQPPDCVRGVAVPGARLSYDMLPSDDRSDMARYVAYLPRAVSPGQVLHSLYTHGPRPNHRAVRTDSGTYRLDWDAVPPAHAECVYSQMIRLPKGSRLVSSSPTPAETIVNGSTTLIWSSSLKPSEGFHTSVEYRIDA